MSCQRCHRAVLMVVRSGTEICSGEQEALRVCPGRGPWATRLSREQGHRDSRSTCQYLSTHVDGDPNGNDRDSNTRSKGDDHGRSQHHAQLPQDSPGP